MKLINEIIAEALAEDAPIASLLRKCLVLAFDLKNDRLKKWVEQELNGYDEKDDVPPYRIAYLFSKGTFFGPMGACISSRPLPMGILEKKHQDMLMPKYFSKPIAAYQSDKKDGEGDFVIKWPPDLIVRYQTKFIEGYALVEAWQELPNGMLRAIFDTVRSRVLRFALEIREELGSVDDERERIPEAKIDAAVTNFIFGGNNVISSQVEQLSQQGNTTIVAGDFTALAKALKAAGIADGDIAELKEATEQDAAHKKEVPGDRIKSWLANIGARMGGAAWKIGTAGGIEVVKEMVMKYLGG